MLDDRQAGLVKAGDHAIQPRLEEFGAEVKRIYGQGLLKAENLAGSGHPDSSIGPENACQYVLRMPQPATFDRAVIMEDLTEGQRIRKYAILGRVGNEMRTIASGTTVGHKKIDIFPPVTVDMLVLEVRGALGIPRIRKFDVYMGGKSGETRAVRPDQKNDTHRAEN